MAGAVWSIRAQKAALHAEQKKHSVLLTTARDEERRSSQHAVSLLIRTFLAERQLSYSALADAHATYAGKPMHSKARITRTPSAMAISYIDGDRQGLTAGYNQRWMWRQKNGAPLEAYAEMAPEAASVVARRLSLMLENYSITRQPSGYIDGRPVEKLAIRPVSPVDGAKGPGKYLSVDKATGLTLETETFDHQWQRTMKSTLSQLDLSPRITEATFASPETMSEAAKRKTWMAHDMGHDRADVARVTGWQPPEPKYLPPGFAFDSVAVHRCNDGSTTSSGVKNRTVAAMTRYTDGLNTLSVFALSEPTGTDGSPEEVCDFGPGTLISRRDNGGFVIAVADLPATTLRKVANATSPQRATK